MSSFAFGGLPNYSLQDLAASIALILIEFRYREYKHDLGTIY